MDEALFSKRRILLLSLLYGTFCLLAACFGVLLSFAAQPGGISHGNAFLAPFLGPWSQTLPPNPHPVSVWSAQYALFARCLTVVLAFALAGTYLATSRWLRYTAIALAVPALVIWVLAGLLKVVSQLH
jgi:ABC-type spermidine/putrescine transport system permease subunit I